ncbi:MAG: helix-turn-helix domain-containing protein, partial [Lachnospiraceae bacterium]|nr:helix-turn-helix domain-containing protein [Lachnospiraceae bacterium]
KYSNFSYIEISNYLAFSSQSHFIQAFEKQTCMTPKKYRDKYHHSAW